MSLTREQYDALVAPLHPSRVSQANGQSHLEAWDVRRHLIRYFGFGGWDFTVVSCDLVAEHRIEPTQPNGNPRWTVVYRVLGRLTIKGPDGWAVAVYEDGATGDAQNQKSIGDAHDMALKTAMSQALKRCAVNLGDQFGLSLYNGGKADPVVIRSAVIPGATVDADELAKVAEQDAPVLPESPAAEPVSGPPADDSAEQDPTEEQTALFSDYGKRLRACKTPQDIKNVGQLIKDARGHGKVTRRQFDRLVQIAAEHKATLDRPQAAAA